MTNSRKISIISLIVIVALAFALLCTVAAVPTAQAEPEQGTVTFTKVTSADQIALANVGESTFAETKQWVTISFLSFCR